MIFRSKRSQLVNTQPPTAGALPRSEPPCNLRIERAWLLTLAAAQACYPAPVFLFMRCIYCQTRAGVLRRVCPACARIVAVVEGLAGRFGWTELIDIFAGEGFTKAEVDRVLDAEIEGAPTLRDRLTSCMANELMKGLGMPGRQSPEDVRRVRHGLASGGQATWSAGEKPPGNT